MSSAGTRPLVGRAADLAAMRSFLATAADRGGGLLLAGDAGVGKSAVLAATAETAASLGFRTLTATGSECGASVGFSGLDQLLSPLREDVDRLSPAHRAAVTAALGPGDGPPAGPLVVTTATLALLRLVAATRPLLLLIDDAQWLDRPSSVVLASTGRRLAGSRVGMIAALRPGSGSPLTRAGLSEHRLRPLDDRSASGLLAMRFPGLAARVRERLVAEAEGNPLALEELPAALTARQRADEEALPVVLPLGRRLGALFTTRVHTLPGPTRELLLLAALDGSGELSVLGAAAGSGGLDALAPGERAGLVSTQAVPGRLVFSHPLVRSAVVEVSPPVERRRAHRALAGALDDRPDRRAWHLAEATLGTDEDVASMLEATARTSLGRGDALGAVTALTRAAELSPAPVDRARRRAEAAYLAADVTGELRRPSLLPEDAPDAEPQPGDSLQAALVASYTALNDDGDVSAAHRLLAGALERVPEDDGSHHGTVAEALHTLLLVCFFAGRHERWGPFDRGLRQLDGRVPETLFLCGATMRDPVRTALPAMPRLTAAIGSLSHVVDPTRIVRTGMAALYVDRLGGCTEALRRVVTDGRSGGAVTSAIDALMLLSVERLQAGAWADAEELAHEGVRLAEAKGYGLLRWPGLLTQSLVAALRGERATVEALCAQMSEWAEPRGVGVVRAYAAHARGLAALGRGDFETAYACAAAVSPPGTFAPDAAHVLWVAMDLVDSAVHTGRRAEAAAHVAAMHEAGIADLSPRLAFLTAGSAALAAGDDQAGALYEKALSLPDAGAWPFELARVQLGHGEHLRRLGAAAAARRRLVTARDGFTRLGAHPWAARASGRPLAAGTTVRADRVLDAAPLTAQQLEIARMAAAGLTNKQIGDRLHLSPRTVGANLYRIFPKLDVTSRSALGDALADRFPTPRAADRSP